jgi:hypothetical protein
MKTIFNTIWKFLESFAQARAAASLARSHRYQEARELMVK